MHKGAKGFTLVEIVMVIILLGVLGIIGTIGLSSAVSSDRGMYERQMESATRYAQGYAMDHFTYAVVVFTPQGSNPSCAIQNGGNGNAAYNGYAVCACNGTAPSSSLVPLSNPIAQTVNNFYNSFSYGITFSAPSFTNNYVAFNSAGQPGSFTSTNNPCPSTTSPPVFNPLAAGANPYIVQISFGALPAQSFYIYPDTGLVAKNGSL